MRRVAFLSTVTDWREIDAERTTSNGENRPKNKVLDVTASDSSDVVRPTSMCLMKPTSTSGATTKATTAAAENKISTLSLMVVRR